MIKYVSKYTGEQIDAAVAKVDTLETSGLKKLDKFC